MHGATCIKSDASYPPARLSTTDGCARCYELSATNINAMAAAEPVGVSRKPSMAPSAADVAAAAATAAAVAVPVGAAPVVPAYVPPAKQYDDDDDDDADEPGKPQLKSLMMQQANVQGPSLTLIFSVALVVITLSAVVTFYALEAIKNAEGETSTAATTSTASEVTNETVQTLQHLDLAGTEVTSVADLLDEQETTVPADTT